MEYENEIPNDILNIINSLRRIIDMKKRYLAILIAVMMILLAACGNSNQGKDQGKDQSKEAKADKGKVVVYSPNSEDIVNTIIPMFEKETGIKVELISAGSGELLSKIEAEKENPLGDVLFGGSKATIRGKADLFEPYVSENDKDMLDDHKNVDGFLTPYTADGSLILVNTDLIGDIKVEGYEDLLNPELKGKIASADASNSSSAFAQLTNQLLAMGGDYENQKGWDYVGKLLENIDGKILNSSSAVHKGVADGEYTVGLTYEDPSAGYVRDGAPVKIIYPKEGTVYLDAGVEVIKGAKNMENAKKFVDFVISKEAQDAFGSQLTNRPLRKDAKVGDHMKPLSEIKVIKEDENYVKEHREEIIKKYTDILVNSREK